MPDEAWEVALKFLREIVERSMRTATAMILAGVEALSEVMLKEKPKEPG